MIPHIQTNTTADPDWQAKGLIPGNCFQTALAAWLDLPVEDVPQFVADTRPGPGWWEAVRTWAREVEGRDFTWAKVDDADAVRAEVVERNLWGGLIIADGITVRGSQHVVLVHASDLSLAHDPHPSGAGLVEIRALWWMCAPYDPDPATQYAEALADTDLEPAHAEALGGAS